MDQSDLVLNTVDMEVRYHSQPKQGDISEEKIHDVPPTVAEKIVWVTYNPYERQLEEELLKTIVKQGELIAKKENEVKDKEELIGSPSKMGISDKHGEQTETTPHSQQRTSHGHVSSQK